MNWSKKMSWNYRLCHRPSIAGGGYHIHEVYYDDQGYIEFYTVNPATPHGDIPDETYEDFCNMMKAFDEEPLNLDYLDRVFKTQAKQKAKGQPK